NRVYLKRNIYKNNNWLINNKGSFDSVDDFVANFDVSFDRSGFNLVINNLTDKNSTTYKTLESISLLSGKKNYRAVFLRYHPECLLLSHNQKKVRHEQK
ncbi:MAG: hypothetical protein WHT29_12615, partial [Bacteroidales bacterium]